MFSTIAWIVGGLLVLCFWEQLVQMAMFAGLFMGAGALVGGMLFGNSGLGATIGFWLALLVGMKRFMQSIGEEYATLFGCAYLVLSLPFWFLNRLQHVLSEPWRYAFKTDWPSEDVKDVLRPLLFGVQILLYVVLTPLRLLNAFNYNIVVYGVTELYDLCFEVLQPSLWKEGRRDVWTWLYMLPYRVVKYPLFHGALVLLEGSVWTVMDIFIPTITMYHGTDLTAGNAIARKVGTRWTDGTFTSSEKGWGGKGVYFASRRAVARGYAHDPSRLSDKNPVMIVCRVSLGRIINYSLAPHRVYSNTGQYGDSAVLNSYADRHGYTTGEWWNKRGGYWEFCMFDWKNRYNHPWRIRPIYVFNFRTGLAQHIETGLRHWLFCKVVADDIFENYWLAGLAFFSCLVVFMVLLALCL